MSRFNFRILLLISLTLASCGDNTGEVGSDDASDAVSLDGSSDNTDAGDVRVADAIEGDVDGDGSDAVDAADSDVTDSLVDAQEDAVFDAAVDADVDSGVPCNPAGVSKGPWVIGVTGDSAVVRWEACREGVDGDLTLAIEGSGDSQRFTSTVTTHDVHETIEVLPRIEPIDWAGTWWMHQVNISGLERGQCYHYALDADSSSEGRFCTARAPGDAFTFVHIGDTNPGLGDSSARLLAATLPPDGVTHPDFSLHGGDIQYYDSLLETWAYWFTRFAPMLRQGAFFAAIGNHEMETDYEYEDYYLRFFEGGGFGGDPRWYSFEWGGVWFFSLDTQSPFGRSSEQGVWLEQALADAAATEGFRFSVVFLHRPFFSCGDNDHHPEEQAELEPLFLENRACSSCRRTCTPTSGLNTTASPISPAPAAVAELATSTNTSSATSARFGLPRESIFTSSRLRSATPRWSGAPLTTSATCATNSLSRSISGVGPVARSTALGDICARDRA